MEKQKGLSLSPDKHFEGVDFSEIRKKLWLKYALDRVLAVVLLILLSPVFLAAAILIKMDCLINPKNRGGVFYTEPRLSEGKIFNIIKFRTVTAGEIKKIREDPENMSSTGDTEKTAAGKIIISFYMDELPQLINILKGEMSFVGPRPHIISMALDNINKDKLVYRKYIRAGLVGPIQARKRDAKYQKMFNLMAMERNSRVKAFRELDSLYPMKCMERSAFGILLFDVSLLFRCIIVVLKGGAKF